MAIKTYVQHVTPARSSLCAPPGERLRLKMSTDNTENVSEEAVMGVSECCVLSALLSSETLIGTRLEC